MRNKIILTICLLWTSLISAQEKISTNQMPYAEGSTSNFEVVISYNNIQLNKETKLIIYISDFKTNAPIENANLELDIAGIDDSKINILSSSDPGIYEALVEFPEIKKYNFLVGITDSDINDLIAINDVDIGQVEDVTLREEESKSFFTMMKENLLFIIISMIIIMLTAFVFYKIGTHRNSRTTPDKSNKDKTNEIII